MLTVNMRDAKSQLSSLVEAVESGAEAEIIIARNGMPAVKLVPISRPDAPKHIGGGLVYGPLPSMSLEEFNAMDDEIAKSFYGNAE